MKSFALLAFGVVAGLAFRGQGKSTAPIVEAKLTNIVVTTTKMDQDARFYKETFGFKPFFHNRTCYFMNTGSANLVFVLGSSKKVETKNLCIDVRVPDLGAAMQKLGEAGVKVDDTDPKVLKLHDPDGNLVEIVKD